MELIRLEDIHKTYHLGEVDVPVLRGISLSIDRGEMVALMGASGSGKTTLMNILGCLDRPSSGKYWLDGQEMSRLTPNQRALVRTEKLGFVFQSFNLLPRTTALHNVVDAAGLCAAPAFRAAKPSGWPRCLLERVGLADRAGPRAVADVGRAAAARGHRPGAGQSPRAGAGRRADRQPRLAHQRRNPADVPATQRRGDHGHPRDARSQGGRLRPSDDPHRRRAGRKRRAHDVGGDGDGTAAGTHSGRIPRRIAGASGDGGGTATAVATASLRPSRSTAGPRHAARSRREPPQARCTATPAKPRASLPSLFPRTLRTALERAAAQQDAVGPDGPGRDHRRRRGHRHDGDRPRLEGRHAEDHRQHGREQAAGPARARPPAAASASGIGSVHDAHAAGRRGDRPAVSRRRRRGARSCGTRAQIVYGNRNWKPNNITGTHAVVPGRARLGGHGRRRHVHRPRRAQRQQGLRDRRRP